MTDSAYIMRKAVGLVEQIRRLELPTQSSSEIRSQLEKLLKKESHHNVLISILPYLRNISRLHGLPQQLNPFLLDLFQQDKTTLRDKLILSQIVLNCTILDPKFMKWEKIEKLIENIASLPSSEFAIAIKSTLVRSVCYLKIDNLDFEKLSVGITTDVRLLLLKKIGNLNADVGESRPTSTGEDYIASVRKIGSPGGVKYISQTNRNRAHAVKSQQKSISKCKETYSEKTELIDISIAAALKERNKTIQRTFVKQVLPSLPPKNDSDQSWYRTTYHEVENLLGLARQRGRSIAQKDFQYLYDRLIGNQFCFSYRITVDKMITEALFLISSKQNIPLPICNGLLDNLCTRKVSSDNDSLLVCKWILQTVQNCISRDSSQFFTPENQSKLMKFQDEGSAGNLEMKGIIMDIFDAALEKGETETVRKIFASAVSNLKNGDLEDRSIRFINLQAIHPRFVLILFSTIAVTELVHVILNMIDDPDIQTRVAEILENYLDHQDSQPLGQKELTKLGKLACETRQENTDLIFSLVRIILSSFEKSKEIIPHEDILSSLVMCSMTQEVRLGGLIVLALKRFSRVVSIPNVEFLSQRLVQDSKISESSLLINPPDCRNSNESEENDEGTIYLSAIVAEVLLNSFKLNVSLIRNSIIYEKILLHVIEAIEISEDAQTRILGAEFVYLVCHDINPIHFNKLKNFLHDQVADVHVFISKAFSNGLLKYSSTSTCIISTDLLLSLGSIYLFEASFHNGLDYSEEINNLILSVFDYEVKKLGVVIPVPMFSLLAEILVNSFDKKDKCLNILLTYCSTFLKGNSVYDCADFFPSNMMQVLLRLLNDDAATVSKTEEIFFSLIKIGVPVPPMIINTLAAKVVCEGDSKHFILLNKASRNQFLESKSFSRLQMELASLCISATLSDYNFVPRCIDARISHEYLSSLTTVDLSHCWTTLRKYVKEGYLLSVFTQRVLKHCLGEKGKQFQHSLWCFATASESGQSVDSTVVEKLKPLKNFPEKDAQLLVKLGLGFLENNQTIDHEMNIWILNYFVEYNNVITSPQNAVLRYVVKQGTNARELPNRCLLTLCKKFEELSSNGSTMQDLVECICYILSNKTPGASKPGKIVMVQTLMGILPTCKERLVVNKILISIAKSLTVDPFMKLNDNDVNILIHKTFSTYSVKVREVMSTLLDQLQLSKSQLGSICLAKICAVEDDLKFIEMTISHLKQNAEMVFDKTLADDLNFWPRLERCLTNEEIKLEMILDILNKIICEKECAAPISLIFVLTQNLLTLPNHDQKMVSAITNIIMTWVQQCDGVPDTLINCLEADISRTGAILKQIQNKFPSNGISPSTKLCLDIECIPSISNENQLRGILKRLQQSTTYGVGPYELVGSMQKFSKLTNNPSLVGIVSEIVSELFLNQSSVEVTEGDMHILNFVESFFDKPANIQRVSLSLIFGVGKLIRKFQNNSELIVRCHKFSDKLIQVFNQSCDRSYRIAVLECHAQLCKTLPNPTSALRKKLMSNLSSPDGFIRKIAFQGLKYTYEMGSRDAVFLDYLKILYEQISNLTPFSNPVWEETLKCFEENSESRISGNTLDLFEAFLSCDHLSLDALKKLDHEWWGFHLLVFHLMVKFTYTEIERITFLEKFYKLQNWAGSPLTAYKITELICTCVSLESVSTDDFISVLDIIPTLTYDEVAKVLFVRSRSWIKTLYKRSLKQMISNKCITQHSKTVDRLISFIVDNIPYKLASKVVESTKKIDDIPNLYFVFNLLKDNAVEESQLQFETSENITELKLNVEKQVVLSKMKSYKLLDGKKMDVFILKRNISSLLIQGISFKTVLLVLESGVTSLQEKYYKGKEIWGHIVRIVAENNIDEEHVIQILTKMKQSEVTEWLKETRLLVMMSSTGSLGNGRKQMSEIIAELDIPLSHLEMEFEECVRFGNCKSRYSAEGLDKFVGEWDISYIKRWSKYVKYNFRMLNLRLDSSFGMEALAVTRRAFFLHSNFELTPVQIISIYTGLMKGLKGQIQQVATGSGKSAIIVILAVINALRGLQVDVFTSNPVLAERDAKSWSSFYSMFGISCSHNGDSGTYLKGEKHCYKSNIVYGETSQFQFDFLRDHYSGLNTLAKRKHEFALIDEADSLLIDDLNKIARLSSPIPGMDCLQILYHLTYHRLLTIERKFLTFESTLLYIEGKITRLDSGLISLQFADSGTGELMEIPDLLGYLQSGGELGPAGIHVVHDPESFVKSHLTNFLTALTSEEAPPPGFEVEPEGKIKIPKHLQTFVENQIPKWVDSCLTAFNYEENKHYVVDEGQIKPVDYNSTGIINNSTAWSDGLHQFLQIKHNLKMTSETATTNFISNISLFRKYNRTLFAGEGMGMNIKKHFNFLEHNIIGFTGTIGSLHTQNAFKTIYNITPIKMPLAYHHLYMSYPDILAATETEWLHEIIASSLHQALQRKRGVLIICESIGDAIAIFKGLRETNPAAILKLYTQNDADQEQFIARIYPGEIFIATNLAGRGTDINTHEIEKFGGLHVCLTFLPGNIRVEEQAFGRTARQGQLGSGQLICRASAACSNSLRKVRDFEQEHQLDNFLQNELPIILAKDSCFEQFCKLLRRFRHQMRGDSSLADVIFSNNSPTLYETVTTQALEERWSFFVSQIDCGRISSQVALAGFYLLARRFSKQFETGRLIQNPFYYIMLGNDYLSRDSKWQNYTIEATECFEKAIQLDEEFSIGGFVGLGYIALKGTIHAVRKNEHGINYRVKAITNFTQALPLIKNEVGSLLTAQTLLQDRIESSTDLINQIVLKLNILGTYSNCVENALKTAKNSIRSVDVVAGKSSGKDTIGVFYHHSEITLKDSFKLTFSDNSVTSTITNLESLHKQGDYDTFSLKLNNLTVSQSTGGKDQAIETLQSISTKATISCSPVSLTDLLRITNVDIYLFSVTKGEALAALQEWRKNSQICMEQMSDTFRFARLGGKFSEKIRNLRGGDAACVKLFVQDETTSGTYKEKGTFNFEDAIAHVNELNDNSVLHLLHVKGNEPNYTAFKSYAIDLEISNLSEADVNLVLTNFIDTSSRMDLRVFVEEKTNPIALSDINQLQIIPRTYESDYVYNDVKYNQGIAPSFCEEAYFTTSAGLLRGEINNIVSHYPKSKFNLIIRNFKMPETISHDLYNELTRVFKNTDVAFTSQTGRKNCVPAIRNLGLEFCILIDTPNFKTAVDCVKTMQITPEQIELSKNKLVDDLFTKGAFPTSEVDEFSSRGIRLLCEFNERLFVPWLAIYSVVTIAALQMAIGGHLVSSGFGFSLGINFIGEGASDLLTCFRGYRNRQFHSSDYIKQKAVSLTISAVSMGMSSLKDAGKGISTVVQEVSKEVAEQTGGMLVLNGKSVASTITYAGKNLKTLAITQVGVAVAEAAAREGVNLIMDKSVNFTLSSFKPQITECLEREVMIGFRRRDFQSAMAFRWALDGDKWLETKVTRILTEVQNPNSTFWSSQWNSVGWPLCRGILSDTKYLGNKFAMIIRIVGILNGIKEIGSVTNKVFEHIKKSLQGEDTTLFYILVYKCKIPIADAYLVERCISKKIVELPSHTFEEYSFSTPLPKELSHYSFSVTKFLNGMKERLFVFKLENIDTVVNIISCSLADHIIKITETQLIAPVTTYAVGQIVSTLSHYVQKNFIVNVAQNTDEMNEKKWHADTIAEQIEANAKTYCIAYQQRDIIIKANQMNNLDTSRKCGLPNADAKNEIEGIATDKPANISTIFIMAKMNDLEVKVVDESYEPTAEDVESGHSIIIYEPPENPDEVGHYGILDPTTGRADYLNSTGDDGGYAVISHLTGVSIKELRQQTAKFVMNNLTTFHQVLQIQQWVKLRYPEESNLHLLVGGRQGLNKTEEDLNANEDLVPNSKPSLKVTKTKKVIDENGKEIELVTEVEAVIPFNVEPGTAPSESSREIVRRIKREFQNLVRGRIISQRLGGHGNCTNIAAMTRSMNSLYYHKFERHLLALLEQHPGANADFNIRFNINYSDNDPQGNELFESLDVHITMSERSDPRVIEAFERRFANSAWARVAGGVVGGLFGGVVGAGTGYLMGGVTGAISGGISGAVGGAIASYGTNPDTNPGVVNGAISGAFKGAGVGFMVGADIDTFMISNPLVNLPLKGRSTSPSAPRITPSAIAGGIGGAIGGAAGSAVRELMGGTDNCSKEKENASTPSTYSIRFIHKSPNGKAQTTNVPTSQTISERCE